LLEAVVAGQLRVFAQCWWFRLVFCCVWFSCVLLV
ncbi:hypothetical protein A2U01_0060282, partial [Trifolium medium]|nr:hypothetical protein [Trifolium medium]